MDLAQYRELAVFAQFGSDLDKATQLQLARGERLVEVLKQDQYKPFQVIEQVIQLYAATNGFVDEVPVSSLKKYMNELLNFINTKKKDLVDELNNKKALSDEIKEKLNAALKEFGGVFTG